MTNPIRWMAFLFFATMGAIPVTAQTDPEAEYYRLVEMPGPAGEIIEVGGLDFFSDGRIAVSTRRGQVWIVEPAEGERAASSFHLFAEGLQEGLGLSVVDDVVHVLQRGELSRLLDRDGDGRCDTVECVCDDWGYSGNYHEFAFGLPRDRAGNFYMALNVAFSSPWWHARSEVPYRGWVLKVTPEGRVEPIACGVRSPCGLALNEEEDLFLSDNQGDWVPSSPIYHIRPGKFYGQPASLAWRKDWRERHPEGWPSFTDPPDVERAEAAIWIPYGWSRSTGNLVLDRTAGAFGPFGNQFFVAEMTNGKVLRAQLEKVGGEYQGAVFPFRDGVGSALRVAFSPEGQLVIGRTQRGWGGQPPGEGLARLEWTGVVPFEIEAVHLAKDGFDLRMTLPAKSLPDVMGIDVLEYDYDWWWEYGSPEKRARHLKVASVAFGRTRRDLHVAIPDLRAGKVIRMTLPSMTSKTGRVLLHPVFAYTINRTLARPDVRVPVAKRVPAPRPRERNNEGYLYLMRGDPKPFWNPGGPDWSYAPVRLDGDDRGSLRVGEGLKGAPAWTARDAPSTPLETTLHHGSVQCWFEVMLAEGASAEVLFEGRYALRLEDDPRRFGALPSSDGFEGLAPDRTGYVGAGKWHAFSIVFDAPRFDPSGRKIAPARLARVKLFDTLLHENAEWPGTSEGAVMAGESGDGPFVFRVLKGAAAIRGVSWKRVSGPSDEKSFERLFDGLSLHGWDVKGVSVEKGALVAKGADAFAMTRDFRMSLGEVRFWVKWSGALQLDVALGASEVEHGDPAFSLGRETLAGRLVPEDMWCEVRIRRVRTHGGWRDTLLLNDQPVRSVEYEGTPPRGGVAFRTQGGDGQVRLQDLRGRPAQ